MNLKKLWKKVSSNWRVLFILLVPSLLLYALITMLSPGSVLVNNGRADLSGIDFCHNQLVSLNGQWEFYWNKLLMPEDFISGQRTKMDSFMKVPGVWDKNVGTHYTRQGFATYRLMLTYPSTLKDPALRIQYVANAYKLYVNGRLAEKAGSSLDDKVNFQNDDKITIIDLPKGSQKVELIFSGGKSELRHRRASCFSCVWIKAGIGTAENDYANPAAALHRRSFHIWNSLCFSVPSSDQKQDSTVFRRFLSYNSFAFADTGRNSSADPLPRCIPGTENVYQLFDWL